MFTYETAHDVGKSIREAIAAVGVPHCEYHLSIIGGRHRPTLFFRVSLDPRESWTNGIVQNSRFVHFSVDHDGRVDVTAWGGKSSFPKWCKFRVALATEAETRIAKWLSVAMALGAVPSYKTHRTGGKSYKVTAMFTGPQRVENANTWLAKNEEHSVLDEANETVYVAYKVDIGKPWTCKA